MTARLIAALIKKDLRLFTRDRFYFLLTIAGIVIYIILYLVMPKTLSENLKMGIYAPGLPLITEKSTVNGPGVEMKAFATLEDLQISVSREEYPVGIALPEGFQERLSAGESPEVTVYFSSGVREEFVQSVASLVKQWASRTAGLETAIEIHPEVLGPDRLGNQIPWRDRFIPLLITLILGTEILSLASLISSELEQNTVRALLLTPLKIRHLLAAKALLGIALAFIQVVLFAVIAGTLSREPLAMLSSLFLGSLLITGLGFLVASFSRNMMNVTTWGMIATIIFFVPAVGILLPGILSGWAEILPSYHLIDAVSRLTNYGAGFRDISGNLLIVLGWTAAVSVAGITLLRRRYR